MAFLLTKGEWITLDKVFEYLTANGYNTTAVGGLLLAFFYLRNQEAGVRNDINTSLQRLQKDVELLREQIEELEAELEEKEAQIDELRKQRRAAEDQAAAESRRADAAEFKLRKESE